MPRLILDLEGTSARTPYIAGLNDQELSTKAIELQDRI